MRIVVVGGGIIGLLTAMECVRYGAQVDLVDQADIPAPLATSNDRQRVVRALHRGDAPLTVAAACLDRAWATVERSLGGHFYHRVGVLTVSDTAELENNLASLAEAGVYARALSNEELTAGYPRLRVAAGLEAVFEPAAGVVLADQALTALATWLRQQPTVGLYPGRRVVAIEDTTAVRLADGAVVAGDCVVVAAGPWSRALLPPVLSRDLTLHRQSVLSYSPMPHRTAWARMPAVLGLGGSRDAWLIPPVAGTLVRLSAASACRPVAEITDRVAPDFYRSHLLDRFSSLLNGFDPAAVVEGTDGYYLTDTDTGGPLLADMGDETVWAYAACGGMSFKFAPLVAGALAERAVGRAPRPTGLTPIDRPRRIGGAGRGVVPQTAAGWKS